MKSQHSRIGRIACVMCGVMIAGALGAAWGDPAIIHPLLINQPVKARDNGAIDAARAAAALSAIGVLGGPLVGLTAYSNIKVTVDVLRDTELVPGGLKLNKPAVGCPSQQQELDKIDKYLGRSKVTVEKLRDEGKALGWVSKWKALEGAQSQLRMAPDRSRQADIIAKYETLKTEALPPETSAEDQASLSPSDRSNDITDGVNGGRIVNEGVQAILAQSSAIDFAMDKRNENLWVTVNSVRSHYGPGDSNTIIYLEKPTEPVLKQATYNPNNFIVANKVAFETAFNSMAGLVGLPDSMDGTGADARNAWVVRAKLAKVKQTRQDNVAKLKDALAQLTALSAANPKPDSAKVADKLGDVAKLLGVE